ncbi:MAG TPA: GMC family oxidoreductase N-terminal domain-containing protein [Desulfosalsimonadaceae bacterium]|nr:GMC family oxidoreductase N-terminal domain-containing protein [Desulfosalsimonadaceae bacterium]
MPLPKTEFDAIEVGTGPGGATVSRELSKAGKKVLILEWGDYEPTRGSAAQVIPQASIPGKSLFLTNQMLATIRGITTGGSSMFYCASAFDPPVDMLKSYGVDISEEASEIKEDVPIAPLSDDLMGPGPQRFLDSAGNMGYNVHKLNKFIYQEKCRLNCQLCTYGCPYGAKWNARHFVDEAVENGAVIINHAKVSKALVENNKAVGVEYRHNRETFQAFAPVTIIAAGGLGSPMILRKSGMEATGYDFFFDPLVYVYGKIKGLGSGKSVPMSTGVHFADDGIVMTDFNLPQLLKIILDVEIMQFKQAFSFANTLPIMIKSRDNLGGELSKTGWVKKTLTKSDKLKLHKGAVHAKRILQNAGASDIYQSWVVAAHPGGTVRIGKNIDANLKTPFDNLYVCDCSVIPQEMGLPPTWTLLSLGKRLAKHLTTADAGIQKEDAKPSVSFDDEAEPQKAVSA